MPIVSRGFRGRRGDGDPSRIPPGQYLERDFPVLSTGPTPEVDLGTWRFSLTGALDEPRTWSWPELQGLGAEEVVRDIHCVTKWTKLDTSWRGISVDALLEGVETEAEFAMAKSVEGYTTNLALADLTGGKAWLAFEYGGEPLDPEHGGPVRLLVPHLYLWGSQVGLRARAAPRRRAGVLGGRGLSRPRRPLARAALPGRLSAVQPAIPWRVGTVAEIRAETATARTLALELDAWPGHRPGQYVDVRLTAEDGYRTQRSYSIATAPEDPRLELTVERYDLGEVSPYLAMEARPGDQLELRGPIGSPFTWSAADGDPAPLLLVGGGSGVVPFRAMLRHRRAAGSTVPATLLVSARTRAHRYYGGELEGLAETTTTLTREAPRGWTGATGRVGPALLAAVAPPVADAPRIFVCGPTGFVEAVATTLVGLGHDPRRIATERFGPSRA